jgi:hypothetical protein
MNYSTTNPPFFEEFSPSNLIPSSYITHGFNEPYGTHLALNPALQTEPQGGQFMISSFDPSPSFSIHTQHDAENASYTQTTPKIFMGPPSRPRKSKAPTLRAKDWEPYKARIVELHITQGLPLKEVINHIQKEFGFTAGYITLLKTSKADF